MYGDLLLISKHITRGGLAISKINQDKVYFTVQQNVEINKRDQFKNILDIGGGGEGVIAQIYGDKVVAIDIDEKELLETPDNKSLKIVMDARNMGFIDQQFDTAISFFSFMYIKNDDLNKVFKEIHRVLKPKGSFLIWDLIIPAKNAKDKDIFAARLEVTCENKIINTGYGCLWDSNEQDVNKFIKLAKKNKFKIIESNLKQDHFYIELEKTN
ncbi:MAG: class I SAM-dependent methyltransferase [Halanaerobiales bacterium]|nr:class I SAM-dependent methyltransferase [Halanaerobiales bacterium]